MNITVDQEKCIGSGQCALTANRVFDQSEDDGTVILLDPTPPTALHAAVKHAAAFCPVRAIKLRDPA